MQNQGQSRITREELYRRIWATPIVKLAKELGYSYPELVQICEKMNVPRPTGGYWYRLAHGGSSEQLSLPEPAPSVITEIEWGPRHSNTQEAMPKPAAIEAQTACASELEKQGGDSRPSDPFPRKEISSSPAPGNQENCTTYASASGPKATSESPVVVTRQALYEKVWRATLKDLAENWGTTYVELVRACERMNVPRPDRSYWSRVHQGLPVEVVPLPHPQPDTILECSLGCKSPMRDARPNPRLIAEQPMQKLVQEIAPPKVSEVPAAATIPTVAMAPSSLGVFTREELYLALWTKPSDELAEKFGISKVELAKTSRHMGIPRPTRSYWARVEAGEKPKKNPLPAAKPDQELSVCFHVAQNSVQAGKSSASNATKPGKSGKPYLIELPAAGGERHPIIEKHQRALEKAKPDSLGYVSITGKDLFRCEVSLGNSPRLLRVMDALLWELEDRDCELVPGRTEYESLKIVKDKDQVTLNWREEKMTLEREPTEADKRRPSWTWQLKETKPSGKLSIEVCAIGLRGKRRWIEGDACPLEKLLGVVLEKIEATFCGFREQREREAEWARQREEQAKRQAEEKAKEAERQAREEKERQERERLKRHETKLEEITEARCKNLAAAAQQWVESIAIEAFLVFCEEEWRQGAGGELTKPQAEWLEWGRTVAKSTMPSTKGYPDPAVDGKVDTRTIPIGGPYPAVKPLTRSAPPPPTPQESPPVQPMPEYIQSPRPPEQFPFWLLHRKH